MTRSGAILFRVRNWVLFPFALGLLALGLLFVGAIDLAYRLAGRTEPQDEGAHWD